MKHLRPADRMRQKRRRSRSKARARLRFLTAKLTACIRRGVISEQRAAEYLGQKWLEANLALFENAPKPTHISHFFSVE